MAEVIINELGVTGNPAVPFATHKFHEHDVPVYDIEGRPYLAGPDLARLLGYKSVRSVNTIHARHADELDPHARLINLRCRDGKPRDTRAYDEPGAYLLTMFATTENAKPVRLWLANLPRRTREILNHAPASSTLRLTTAKERNALTGLVNRYVGLLPGGPHPEAYKAAWGKVHEVIGIGAIEELTVEQLPRAVMFVQSLLNAMVAPDPEPKALPAPESHTIRDYARCYGDLPEKPDMWRRLSFKAADAFDRFGKELDTIRDEAFAPFKRNRRSDVRTFLDEVMGPHYVAFRIADEQIRTAYRCIYEALDGLIGVHDLLRKG